MNETMRPRNPGSGTAPGLRQSREAYVTRVHVLRVAYCIAFKVVLGAHSHCRARIELLERVHSLLAGLAFSV